MRHILGNIFMYGGAITAVVCLFIVYFKALNDDEVDKQEMVFGTYIFNYPVYTVLIIAGAVLAFFGYIWRI